MEFNEFEFLEEIEIEGESERTNSRTTISEEASQWTLIEIQNEAHQDDMVEENYIVNSLQQVYEIVQQSFRPVDEIAQTIRTTEATEQNVRKLEESIDNNEGLQLSDVEVKMNELKKCVQELETKLHARQHKNTSIEDIEEKIIRCEANFIKLINEYNEKVKEKEQMNALKIAENNRLKIEREERIKENQMFLMKKQLLDEQIAVLERKIEELKASKPNVGELSSQKTYFDTCNTYFKEYVTILENYKVEVDKNVNLLIKQNNTIKTAIEECKKELREIRNISSLPGIPEKKNQPNKQSTSPKPVQFLNMSSDESSVITDQQPSTSTFDQLCEHEEQTRKKLKF